jgi:hypothetical protein
MTEQEFWLEFYNGSVEEFAALVRELNAGQDQPRPLPETFADDRAFPVGKADWDLLVEATGELQRTVNKVIGAVVVRDLQ